MTFGVINSIEEYFKKSSFVQNQSNILTDNNKKNITYLQKFDNNKYVLKKEWYLHFKLHLFSAKANKGHYLLTEKYLKRLPKISTEKNSWKTLEKLIIDIATLIKIVKRKKKTGWIQMPKSS